MALLVAQVLLIFIAEPLAFEGFEPPLIAIGFIVVALILWLVLGSEHQGALIVVGIAGELRAITLVADLVWGAPMTEAAEGVSAILGLAAVMWVIVVIVFGPGRITAHRVGGRPALSLDRCCLRLALPVDRRSGSRWVFGLKFAAGQHGALSPFLYYSLTSLTTLGSATLRRSMRSRGA